MKRILALLATAATLSGCGYESEDDYLRATLPDFLNCVAEADAARGIVAPATSGELVEMLLKVKHKLDGEGRDFYLWLALGAEESGAPETCRSMLPTKPSPFLVSK
jgi:hypothetical protein